MCITYKLYFSLIIITLFIFNLENTLGVDERILNTLEAEVDNYKEELNSLSDTTEEQKLEVNILSK